MAYGIELYDCFGNPLTDAFRASRLLHQQNYSVALNTTSIAAPSGWVGSGASANGFVIMRASGNNAIPVLAGLNTSSISLAWNTNGFLQTGDLNISWYLYK